MKKRIYIITYFTFKDGKSIVAGQRPYRLYEFLKEKGVDVTIVTVNKNLGNEIVVPELKYKGISLLLSRLIPPDRSILWGIKVYRKLKSHIDKDTLIFTTAPPHGLSISGLLLKLKNPQITWVADYRDLWVDNPLHSNFFTKKLLDPILEKIFHKKEDLAIFNTKWDLDFNISKYSFLKSKSIFVRNGVDRILEIGSENKKGLFIYSGGTTKGQATRAIENIMIALNKLGLKSSCDFYGRHDSLMDSSPYINYKGLLQPDEIPGVLSKYKFGFVYLPSGCEKGGRVAQKFYDYLGAGVIPICYQASIEMVDIMNKYRTGISITAQTNSNEIIKFIREATFNAHAAELVELKRVTQFEKLYKHLGEL